MVQTTAVRETVLPEALQRQPKVIMQDLSLIHILVPMRAILDAADKNGYAQGAFNVNAVCQVKAAVDVHQILRSPARCV